MQVAIHAQKYFMHLKVIPKEKRRARILDITREDAKVVGTLQVVPSTKKKSTLPGESINADQTIAAAKGESAVANRFSMNAPQDMVAAHVSRLPSFAPSSVFNVVDSPM
ncbi:hypothetical protein CQW23_32768 [Capsicum baccatum]|uniref:Uncharacterized protein n=1 Tax=Capsicum baccatum TaxID=33114 RepID=A0A2G2V3Y4_CAPBA|nr:hypothetical protein CQW23_32768 [Capsicum baccatum]